MKEFFDKVKEDLQFKNTSNKGIKEEQISPIKQKILEKMIEICSKQKIIVEKLSREDSNIEENDLTGDLQRSIILESHISEDIGTLNRILNNLEFLMNHLYGVLYDVYKNKNKFKLKGMKEIDVYIFQDEVYNTLNLRIKNIKSQITKSERNYNTMKQKTSAIRELIRMKTQILYNEGRKSNGN